MTTRIYYDSIEMTRPHLRYEAEHDGQRFYGFVIRTEGAEKVPVTLVFERAFGHLVFADRQMHVERAARRLGLERAEGGGWKMPAAWLDANPHRHHPWPETKIGWGEWFWDVEPFFGPPDPRLSLGRLLTRVT